MAKIFLDANFFIDILENRDPDVLDSLESDDLYISPLSLHILIYVYKYKVPDKKLAEIGDYFNLVPISEEIAVLALQGPTSDFEDNIQLHSASDSGCSILLTGDKRLLKLGCFGKVRLENAP